jgi:hypothetical protein
MMEHSFILRMLKTSWETFFRLDLAHFVGFALQVRSISIYFDLFWLVSVKFGFLLLYPGFISTLGDPADLELTDKTATEVIESLAKQADKMNRMQYEGTSRILM